jgi:hypothetical protein
MSDVHVFTGKRRGESARNSRVIISVRYSTTWRWRSGQRRLEHLSRHWKLTIGRNASFPETSVTPFSEFLSTRLTRRCEQLTGSDGSETDGFSSSTLAWSGLLDSRTNCSIVPQRRKTLKNSEKVQDTQDAVEMSSLLDRAAECACPLGMSSGLTGPVGFAR